MEDIGPNVKRYLEAAVLLSSLPDGSEEWDDQADSMDLLWHAMSDGERQECRKALAGEE